MNEWCSFKLSINWSNSWVICDGLSLTVRKCTFVAEWLLLHAAWCSVTYEYWRYAGNGLTWSQPNGDGHYVYGGIIRGHCRLVDAFKQFSLNIIMESTCGIGYWYASSGMNTVLVHQKQLIWVRSHSSAAHPSYIWYAGKHLDMVVQLIDSTGKRFWSWLVVRRARPAYRASLGRV